MREIKANQIKDKAKELFLKANYHLDQDLMHRLDEALKEEASPIGKSILQMIIKNNQIASSEELAICQDTGLAVFFMAKVTNRKMIKGTLADAIVEAEVFLGLSVAGALKPEMVKTMASDAIIFAMANPTPEIMPNLAKAAGARIVCTGRSDFPNQVNNCLGFPAIFKGALKVRASQINEEMKLAAAYALASLISDDELNDDYIIVDVFDPRVVERESEAVANAAIESGVARV